MQGLQSNDCFINGKSVQYKEIAKLLKFDDKFWENLVISNMEIRKGCFWSERLKTVIPGHLNYGNKLDFNTFISRLKVTLDTLQKS